MRQHHNIIGSEAFRCRQKLHLQEQPRRQPSRATLVRFYLGAMATGAVLALIDLAIAAPIPICLSVGAIFVLVAWLRA